MNCLAIDMGASNIRIMLGHVTPDTLEYREVYRFANTIVEKSGHERWDIELIGAGIIKGINMAAEGGIEIASLGVDAWGVDFVLLDGEGRPIEDPVAYRDSRTEGMEEKWTEIMSREETFERSGINFYIFNTLFQLLSIKGRSLISGTSKLLFMPSYISSLLCGKGMNELTISSTSQLLNASTGEWDDQILRGLGLHRDLFGSPCPPGTVLGKVDHDGLQLPGAKMVAVCAHDTASAVAAVPFTGGNSVFISTGTWCIVGIESERAILSAEALGLGFTNERGYGDTFRFLKNIVGLWLVQGLLKSLPVEEDYDQIEKLALEYEGPPHIINPGDPVFYNPENMREAFDENLRSSAQELPSGPGGYFRCAYDSLIFSFRYHIEKIEEMTGRSIDTIHLIGGGSRSEYLNRQTADICRRRVISGPVEAATLGNILVQSIAMGILPGLREARELVFRTMSVKTYEPATDLPSAEPAYRKFLELTA